MPGVKCPDGSTVTDTMRIVSMVHEHYTRKWGVDSEAGQDRVVSALAALSEGEPAWTDTDVVEAFGAVRRPDRVDADGIAPAAAAIVAAAVPRVAGVAVRQLAGSSTLMSCVTVRAVPLGKKSAMPAVEHIRALLPLCTVLTVIDLLLSRALHAVCDARAVPPSFWGCAVSGDGRRRRIWPMLSDCWWRRA